MLRMYKIDKINRKLLEIIQNDGRSSNQDVAEKLNLSPSPCLQRRKYLEEKGVITGYSSQVDLKKIARHVFVWAEVTLKHNKVAEEKIFEKYLMDTDYIIKALALGGKVDYLVLFCVPSVEFYQTATYTMMEETNIIKNLTSHFVMREVKKFEGFPLSLLLDAQDATP